MTKWIKKFKPYVLNVSESILTVKTTIQNNTDPVPRLQIKYKWLTTGSQIHHNNLTLMKFSFRIKNSTH